MIWSHSFDTVWDTRVTTDAQGNIFLAYSFYGTANLGGGTLSSGNDIGHIIAKFNSSGVHQWSHTLGDANVTGLSSISVTSTGRIVVAGTYNGTTNLGGANLLDTGGYMIFMAAYDPAGAHVWSFGLGNGQSIDISPAVVGPSDVIWATGSFRGTVNLGGGDLTSEGDSDIFVMRYTQDGSYEHSWRMGSTGVDAGTGIAVSSSPTYPWILYLTGIFNGSVRLQDDWWITSVGSNSMFIARFDYDEMVYSRVIPTNLSPWGVLPPRILVTNAGDSYLYGRFAGALDFGNSATLYSATLNGFVAHFDEHLNYLWVRQISTAGQSDLAALAVDASGKIYAAGGFNAPTDFGAGLVTPNGDSDAYLAYYDAAGILRSVEHYLVGGTGWADGLTMLNGSDPVITGIYSGVINLRGTFHSSAYGAGFIARLLMEPDSPVITSITDVGNDEGRKVLIRFNAPGADRAGASPSTVGYVAMRRSDPLPAMVHGTGEPVRADGWVEVASIRAFGEPAYLIEAPTLADSTIALGQYLSVFKIRAASDVPAVFSESAPDSGYSLDNLAPGPPQNFVYSAGNLSWNESSAADFDYFTVYGSNTDSFGSATVVNYSVTPAMNVAGSPHVYYFVTATDFSGNEGKFAKVNSLSGTGGTPQSYVLSVANYPNPFNPRTTVSYTVPSRGAVRVALFDAHGARVRTLFEGEREAGAYSLEWDGRADGGATVGSGVYFARIEHNGASRSKKMVLLK